MMVGSKKMTNLQYLEKYYPSLEPKLVNGVYVLRLPSGKLHQFTIDGEDLVVDGWWFKDRIKYLGGN